MTSRKLFSLLFFFITATAAAQTYPVQLSLQLAPPFSGYLPDYASPANENFRIYELFTDFSHPSYDIKFKIKIEGQGVTLQSAWWYFAGPFTVEPGVPQMLSGNDLAGLLDENNLDFSGITRQDYDQRKVLPEGFYTITVTAYDFNNSVPVQVSNEAITQVWMVLNDAPLLNFPACGSSLAFTDPQQITFSWTPLNMSSPSSFSGTTYTFDLWEIFPANSSPGNIVATTAPLYSTTTTLTMLNYGITEPPLVNGRQYVWRIRAQDDEGRELFHNNGYSELCTFTWGDNNALGNLAQLHLNAQATSNRMALCAWDSLSVFTSYNFQFRKTGSQNWFPSNTHHVALRVADLEPSTDYEAQVQGVFPNGETGPWSNTATWHTYPTPQYNCGEMAPPPAMQNFHPLTQAYTNMIWQVGQFEMHVTSLENFSSFTGHYCGTGRIVTPLAGISLDCIFSNVLIGDDHVLYAGEVRAASEGVNNWIAQQNANNFQYDTSYFYNGDIDSVYTSNGQIIIVDANGNSDTLNIVNSGGVLITDNNGDQWIVNPDGSVTFVTGGFILPVSNDTLNAQEMQILRDAMTLIRNALPEDSITAKQQTMLDRGSTLENFIETQQQSVSGNNSSPSNGTTTCDTVEFVSYSEETPSTQDQGYQLASSWKGAQVDYYAARVLKEMSREDCLDEELNFIGQYLTVNDVPFRQFVAQQTAAGRTHAQIVNDVAEDGVKKLVETVLKKQMGR